MSQVSPVFHTEVTMNHLELTLTPKKKLFNSPSFLSLFIWVQDWVKTEFQTNVLTLINDLTENRTRHARGPVHTVSSVTYFCI